MTAEEFLINKYLEQEKELEAIKKENAELANALADASEEIADFEKLVDVLAKRVEVTKYGISIDLKNYIEDDKCDIDFLANYFEVDFDDEEETEQDEE